MNCVLENELRRFPVWAFKHATFFTFTKFAFRYELRKSSDKQTFCYNFTSFLQKPFAKKYTDLH